MLHLLSRMCETDIWSRSDGGMRGEIVSTAMEIIYTQTHAHTSMGVSPCKCTINNPQTYISTFSCTSHGVHTDLNTDTHAGGFDWFSVLKYKFTDSQL